MPHFVTLIDRDREHRARFAAAALPATRLFETLDAREMTFGDMVVCWSASTRAPVSISHTEDGAAVLWGEAIPGPGPERVDADGVLRAWSPAMRENGAGNVPFASFDGFHAAVCTLATGEVAVGADLIGTFPIYYAQLDDAVLVGTSPSLFAHHPRFRVSLDARGFVGYLLLGHTTNGDTLVRGVRRLTPGKMLFVDRALRCIERDQYTIPTTDEFFDLPFDAHVDRLHEALEGAFRRHLPAGRAHTIMMSGGLDSRMLAGYLQRHGQAAVAVTMGDARDVEARSARAVARAAGWPHQLFPSSHREQEASARFVAGIEHLSGGFNNVGGWRFRRAAASLPPFLITGHVVDVVVGSANAEWKMWDDVEPTSFDRWFASFNKWGLAPDLVRKLLRAPDAAAIVDEVIESLRASYASLAPLDSQRAWRLELMNRSRMHVGSPFWRMAFDLWPVRPVIDRAVFAAVGGMPMATLGGRRVEAALVAREFPRLAALPLDRAGPVARPLRPTLGWLLRHAAQNRIDRVRSKLGVPTRRGVFFQQLYDFDGAAWRSARRGGETARALAETYLDAALLRRLLPAPDVAVPGQDRVLSGTTPKALLGFFYWLATHGADRALHERE